MPHKSARIVAIITARGGSKALPRKNIADLCGKPLIAYSIEAGKNCDLVADVFVSTDDQDIAAVSAKYGANIIERPAGLATDDASSYDTVKHALEYLEAQGKTYDYFVLLQPTSPLRNEKHVAACLEQFLASGKASVMSVCEAEYSPYKALKLDDGNLVPLLGEEFLERPRQNLEKVYRQNGAIYAMKCHDFLNKTRSFYLAPSMAYVMDEASSIDIDAAYDLELAAFLMKRAQA